MKELANKLITKEIVNLKLAKLRPQLYRRTPNQRVVGRHP